MRVLFISHSWPTRKHPYWGYFIKESIENIAKRGIDVEVVSPKPFGYGSNIPKCKEMVLYKIHFPKYLYWLPKKLFYHRTASSFENLTNYVLENCKKPDLIHAETSYLDACLGRVLVGIWNVPLIIHARGTLERQIYHEYKKVGSIMNENLKFAKKIVCVSEELKKRLEWLGMEKTVFIPNGVNTKDFFPRSKKEARKKINVPLNEKMVLFIGDLKKEKGIEVLYQTIALMKERDFDIAFYIIGTGKLQRNAGHKYNCHHIGPVPHKKINFWLNATDILVVPSLTEGRPNVILEAMACGTPIIGSNLGGIPELLKNHGILVEPGNSHELTEKIIRLLSNTQLMEEFTKNSLNVIKEKNLTWEVHTQKMVKLYEELITQKD